MPPHPDRHAPTTERSPGTRPRRLPRLLATLVLALAQAAPLSMQAGLIPDYSLREWRTTEGLPSNEVTDIRSTPDGFLWIGSASGLVRFDGRHFSNIEVPAPPGRPGLGIQFIDTLPDGAILVAPRRGGLLRFAAGTFTPARLPEGDEATVLSSLKAGPDGVIWAGLQRGVLLRIAEGRTERFDGSDGLDSRFVTHIAFGEDGETWLASGKFLARYRKGALEPVPVPGVGAELRIASGRGGKGPWVITEDRILRWDGKGFVKFAELPAQLGAHYVQNIHEDEAGSLLLATRSSGLHRIAAGKSSQVIDTHDDIYSLHEDGEGNIWVGLNGAGIVRLRTGLLRVLGRNAGLRENYSFTVCEDAEGTLWFANRDGGVAYLKDGQVGYASPPADWGRFSVKTISPAAAGGTWVCGTQGLISLDPARRTPWLLVQPAPPLPQVRGTYSTSDGTLWMSVDPNKLGRFRDGTLTLFGQEQGLGGDGVRSLVETPDKVLWTGTTDGSLYRLEKDRFVCVPLPRPKISGAIQAMIPSALGGLWLGTETGGLLHYREGCIQSLDSEQGLPTDNIMQIQEDEQGALWLGSPHAIFRLTREELEAWQRGEKGSVHPTVLGIDDGLREISCLGYYQPSSWRSRDGMLWFTAREGVVAIDPRRDKSLTHRASVRIERLVCDGKPRLVRQAMETEGGFHKLELHFSVLCLSTPGRVNVQYRMVGFDEDWIEAGAESSAKYPRLPAGDYRFELRSRIAGNDTILSAETIPLRVLPRWWQAPWLQVLVLLSSASLLALAVRTWSRRRLLGKLERLEREQAVERERTRIARNIHDDLGASLTRISLLTQAAQDGETGHFEKIYDTVSEITRSMDEIVWAVNPRYDSLASLLYYLGTFAQKLLNTADIRYRLDAPTRIPELPLSSQERHNLFLCCREALNNAVKHSGASEVTLCVGLDQGLLTLAISDNGRGGPSPLRQSSEQARISPGNGLRNLQERMAEIGGSFHFTRDELKGATATFRLPCEQPRPST